VNAGSGARRLHPLRRSADIQPYQPLRGVSAAPKRAARRLLRWYLWPVTAQVSAHNRAVADVVEEHRRTIAWMRMEAERLEHDIALSGPPQ
jgi:hypothetical protein